MAEQEIRLNKQAEVSFFMFMTWLEMLQETQFLEKTCPLSWKAWGAGIL